MEVAGSQDLVFLHALLFMWVLRTLLNPQSPFTFLVSIVTLGYTHISKSLELGSK